jgi:4-diphosphocytidyl-2C-methyl-D-erythritol kinase
MSGSGSAVFGLFDTLPDVENLFQDCFAACGRFD